MTYKGPLDYIDVAARIAEFRTKYPTGSLQQHDLKFVDFAGKSWVVYTAAAYRTPDDVRPGMGTAWEPVPGATNFTRDSELQNAETAAWGRAIVAALAADTKKGVASAEEIRNRSEKPSAPRRDFLEQARVFALSGDLEALQGVYKAAVAGIAPKEVIAEIKELGQTLKQAQVHDKPTPDGNTAAGTV